MGSQIVSTATVPQFPTTRGVMPISNPVQTLKPVGVIRRMLNRLASICGELIKIALIAIKAMADDVTIKFMIKPIIGCAAFLPTLTFLVEYKEIEGEINLGECFEVLQSVFNSFAGATV
jgi:hypothetical protein